MESKRTAWVRFLGWVAGRLPERAIGDEADPFFVKYLVAGAKHLGAHAHLHRFLRSDRHDALHDHPWWGVSVILAGRYRETRLGADGVIVSRWRRAGQVYVVHPLTTHRVDLAPGEECWSLFVNGPAVRRWRFYDLRAHRYVDHEAFIAQEGLS